MESREKTSNEDAMIGAWFLGPKLENHDVLQKLTALSLSKTADFRQSYFPTDPELITKEMKESEEYKHHISRLEKELNKLCSELKMSNNMASTRWQGLAVGDPTLPSNLGYMAALLSNSNNHVNSLSPATTAMELKVGDDLCDMLGYDLKSNPSPWGHLTIGGTMSNMEGLWSAGYIKYYPLAVQRSAVENEDLAKVISAYKIYVPGLNSYQNILDCTVWNLMNLDVDDIVDLSLYIQKQFGGKRYLKMIEKFTVRHLGWSIFMKTFDLEEEPVVLMSSTSHYSFKKAMQVLGFGDENLIKVHVDANGRMNVTDLHSQLQMCLKRKRPVITVIAVHGTTEFGSIDPLADILQLRDKFRKQGLNFTLHVDAAIGGYYASLLKDAGQPHGHHTFNGDDNEAILSTYSIKQFKALKYADTITIDPHKTGLVPYSAGAICYRNGFMRLFIDTESPIVYDDRDKNVGLYGIEGSRPGAPAASILLSHRVIGLHKDGYGKILGRCALGAKLFFCKLLTMGKEDDNFITVPLQPLPTDWTLDDTKSFIRRNINGKCLTEIKKNKKVMSFLKEVGSDTCINPFVINMKIGGKLNSDVSLFNALNTEMYCRLSHVNNRHDMKRIPLILGKTFIDEIKFQKCLPQVKTSLNLKGSGGLAVLVNTVMNPWIVHDGKIELIGNVLRQTILDSIGLLTDSPASHCFVASCMINDCTVFGEYCSASFDTPSHQYQAIVKFKFLNRSDAELLKQEQANQRRKLPADRKPLLIQNDTLDVLGSFLTEASDTPYTVNCYFGNPGDKSTTCLSQVSVMVEDIPMFRHFDMTRGDNFENFNYFLYGDQNRTHLSHKTCQCSNFVQVIDLTERPDGIPLALLEHGLEVNLEGLPRGREIRNGISRDWFAKSKYKIEYIGKNGKVTATTMWLNLNNDEVFFGNTELGKPRANTGSTSSTNSLKASKVLENNTRQINPVGGCNVILPTTSLEPIYPSSGIFKIYPRTSVITKAIKQPSKQRITALSTKYHSQTGFKTELMHSTSTTHRAYAMRNHSLLTHRSLPKEFQYIKGPMKSQLPPIRYNFK